MDAFERYNVLLELGETVDETVKKLNDALLENSGGMCTIDGEVVQSAAFLLKMLKQNLFRSLGQFEELMETSNKLLEKMAPKQE